MTRPEWNNLGSYPKLAQSWSFSHWAWEFLRRNQGFQAICDAKSDAPSNERQMAARKYGLAEYKHYKEGHGFGAKCIWLTEAICEYQLGTDQGDEVEFTLDRGEVALVFDLMQVEKGGIAAIDAQLHTARTTLIEYLQEIGAKCATTRVTKIGLFELLRIYDGVEYSCVTPTEVAKVLYPDAFTTTSKGYDDRATQARRKLHDQLARARRMVKSGYLALPSRDYRQDRAKRKVSSQDTASI